MPASRTTVARAKSATDALAECEAVGKRADIICGGFPCTDVSVAGKREGIQEGTRSGLWKEMLRIIRVVRPPFVVVENVPGLLSCGMGTVLGDLAEIGYDAEWTVLSAASQGAPHRRDRVFIVAYTDRRRVESWWAERKRQRRRIAPIGAGSSLANTTSE